MDSQHEGSSTGARVSVGPAAASDTGTAYDSLQQSQGEGAWKDRPCWQDRCDPREFESAGEAPNRRAGTGALWTKRAAVQLSVSVANSDARAKRAATVD